MKRIVTVQDVSCVGKCSLTVALPIISACGIEAAVIPTAVLSTHTAFSGFTFRDLTDEIEPIAGHWKKEGIGFDAIYTGYLGSFRQIDLMKRFFSDFGKDGTLLFVDPAMADNGQLYKGFTPEFAKKMAELCAMADIIVPNISEACFMLDKEYIASGYSREYVKDLLKSLCALGAKTAVLTGISFEDGKIGAMGYTAATDTWTEYYNEKIDVSFHGTGDVFSSACVGALSRGLSLEGALRTAVNYTLEAIKQTVANKEHNWYGVDFETAIPLLLDELNTNK